MNLPNGWQLETLGTIAKKDYGLVDGPFGSSLPASEYTTSGIPVIRGSNLTLGEDRFKDDDFVFVSRQTADKHLRSICVANDIIFTKKGTLGQTGFVPEAHKYKEFLLSSNQMKLSVDMSCAYPLFVYYYVSSPSSREKIVRDAEATGVPKTNLAYLRTFPILLPPPTEQRAIAAILGSLDDKIELNRKTNATLEELARTLFHSWFVEFAPVRAKAAGHAPHGMDAATAALFPDSFEDSPLGPVPRGWRVSTIGDVCDFAYGRALKESERQSGSIPVFGSNGQIGWHNQALAASPSVVIGRKGNPGTVTWVSRDFFAIDTTFYVVLKKELTSMYYIFYALASANLSSLSADSAVPGLNRNIAYSKELLLPPSNILERFDRQVAVLLVKASSNQEQSRITTDIRDTLLPKLLSGALRVKDIEATL